MRAALAAAGLILLAGCSAGGGARTVTIDVHHSRFSIDELDVRPGETIRFVVRNSDPIPHELIVGDQSVQDVHEAGTEAHHGDRPGEVSVAPGATAVTTYRFDRPGRLLFGCQLPGHRAYGMRRTISVG